jgi:hypothetical protein
MTYANINILQSVAQTHATPLTLPSIGRLIPVNSVTITMKMKYKLFTICILKYLCGTNVLAHSYRIVQRIAAFDKRMKIIVIVLFRTLAGRCSMRNGGSIQYPARGRARTIAGIAVRSKECPDKEDSDELEDSQG